MAATTHLELLIDVDSDPITGSVSNGDARARSFTGWIDLVAVIEAARAGDPGLDPQAEAVQGPDKTLGSLPGAKASER